jgi:CheY-like chemotaxis protein/anti-sigma regulatory factor (Ser/Thr protein kinase)
MPTVLVVDDSLVERHRVGALLEKPRGLTEGAKRTTGIAIAYAANGLEALDTLRRSLPDLVLTDLQMPEMNGLELVERIRADYPSVPVILMTAHGSEEIAVQALQRGAAGYVPKRNVARDLLETVETTLALTQVARDQERVRECLTDAQSRFLLQNDPGLIGPLVGYLHNNLTRVRLCDEIGVLRVTVALRESLVNAMEHGNLEVPSVLKEDDERSYRQLLEDRRRQSPYRERHIHVTARETPAEVVYVIRDEGPGFNPATLPDPTDPANLEKASGRGILLIRTFMDQVTHNASGNEITLVKRRER